MGPRELPGSSEGPQKTRRPCMALGQFVLPEASMDQMTILGQLIRIRDPRGPSPGLRGRGGGGALKGRAVGSLKSADQADATHSRATTYFLLVAATCEGLSSAMPKCPKCDKEVYFGEHAWVSQPFSTCPRAHCRRYAEA